ncbi:hypothetical protein Patl1_20382 [Pistacia atlantica]|uniref:Uncharacterized protein n=1 Tax=Pistacia atlantica TaxID=434234 RepID=A0ACC1BJL4_9ROSI|nr:hypothetical protein Patl1_20382 [Pistacia atlantica]
MPKQSNNQHSLNNLAAAMAIVLNLRYLLLLLLLTLSPTFFLHPQNLANADDALIEQQCRQTDAPETCLQCIKSDPEAAKKADKPETIATMLVTCLSDDAEILEGNMSTLASSVSEDKNFKGTCEDCSKCYHQAKTKLTSAMDELKKGDYDEANHIVVSALINSRMVSCGLKIQSYKSKVPDDVLNKMRIYAQLSGVAMNIIDRLSHEKEP